MLYTILYRSAIKKDIKRLEKSVSKTIKDIILKEIAVDPYQGKQLKAKNLIYSWKIRLMKTDYRIAYQINRELREIVILMVGTRENFYKELEKRI